MTNKLWDPRRKALQNALKAARLKSGMTQKNLSDLLGKPQSYVSKYESGERRVDFIEVLEICEALQWSLVQLTDTYHQDLADRERVALGIRPYMYQEDRQAQPVTLHDDRAEKDDKSE